MTLESLAAALLAVLVQTLPPDRTAALHAEQYPSAAESGAARQERYAGIASDIATAALEQGSRDAQLDAAALLAAVAVRESRLDPDVDRQWCTPERVASRRWDCDGGRSGTIFQLRRPPATRLEAARRALSGMLAGRRQCARAGLPPLERLGGHFLGRGCDNPRGRDLSRDRETFALQLQSKLRTALRVLPPGA